MGLRRWIALVAIALGALAVVAAPAGGHRGGPQAHIACAQDATDCTEQGDISMPAQGTGVQATDVVPKGSTQGDEIITPFSKDDLKTFDALWYGVVDATPSLVKVKNVFVRRLLTCALIGPAVASYGTPAQVAQLAPDSDPATLFAQVCVQTVYATYLAERGPSADVASNGCRIRLVSIPVEIRRSGRKYIAQINARTQKPAGRSPLALSCRKRSPGLQISMHPRARHRKLYQVLGGHMTVGFANTSSTPVRVHTRFAFR
jgi:hypothetical protein